MLPTPLCTGKNDLGMRPCFISFTRKSHTFAPILSVVSSTGVNGVFLPSGIDERTTHSTFLGSTWAVAEPALS